MNALYRCYDAESNLLYIGISRCWPNRFVRHLTESPWFTQVRQLTIQYCDSREDAQERERRAIRDEKPQHNTLRYEPTPKVRKPDRSTKVTLTDEVLDAALEIVRRKNTKDPLYQANLQRVVNTAVLLYRAQVEEEEADNA